MRDDDFLRKTMAQSTDDEEGADSEEGEEDMDGEEGEEEGLDADYGSE